MSDETLPPPPEPGERVSVAAAEAAAELERLAQIEVEAAALNLPLPSYRTLYRLMNKLDRQRHSFGNATTRRTQANRPDRAYGQQAPSEAAAGKPAPRQVAAGQGTRSFAAGTRGGARRRPV